MSLRDLSLTMICENHGQVSGHQELYKCLKLTMLDYLCLINEFMLSSLNLNWQFITSLKDNLNAEVALGTVTNVKEACAWLGYTYLFIRMKMNPLAYGIGWDEVYS